MKRDKFTFHASFFESISTIPKKRQLAMYTAVLNYAFYGIEAEDVHPDDLPVYLLITRQLDIALVRRQRVNQPSPSGRKRGGQVGNSNARKYPAPPRPSQQVLPPPFQPPLPPKSDHDVNLEHLARYFHPDRSATLEALLMQLHTVNPATRTIEDFKRLAWFVVSEWEQEGQPAQRDYSRWARWLYNSIRIRNKNGTRNPNWQDPVSAKQQRDQEFAQFIAAKLSGSQ